MSAARAQSRVALVTCAELADLYPDDRLVVAPLRERGIDARPVVWDDPSVDWAEFDLAVLRSTWDYPARRDEFLRWAARVPGLANPADVVAWNTDKRYLAELSAAGLPVVPTGWLPPGGSWAMPASGEYVVKPAIGAGSIDTGRYILDDPEHRRLAVSHVDRLQAAGQVVMVQPYLPAVDTTGETALLYIGGAAKTTASQASLDRSDAFSHAVRKGPMLTGPEVALGGLFKEEAISPRMPTPEELAVGARVLAAVPGGDPLYARVDLIPGGDGGPLVIEVELTEPSLFLGYAEGAPDRFAEAIAARLRT